MELMDRRSLKNLFKKGSFPKEANFITLIDSTVNIVDDGLAKDPENGLRLSPTGTSKKLISFYRNVHEKNPEWNFSLNPDTQSQGLGIGRGENGSPPSVFLQEDGKVGIGTTNPGFMLEVAGGPVGMPGRLGTYRVGRVPADGHWQNVFPESLTGNRAFEVTALVEVWKQDLIDGRSQNVLYRHALMHSVALCSYGKWGRGSISSTQSCRGPFWYKLAIRWTKEKEGHGFQLQLRTRSNYGSDEQGVPRQIFFRVASLWED